MEEEREEIGRKEHFSYTGYSISLLDILSQVLLSSVYMWIEI